MKKFIIFVLALLPCLSLSAETWSTELLAYEGSSNSDTRTSSKSKKSSRKTSSSKNTKSSKKWTGASSMADFKSKIVGTTWGTTQKHGDFYYTFTIKNDEVVINTYITSDFHPEGKIGASKTEPIKEWTNREGNSGKVYFIIAGDTSSSMFGINATLLGFSSNSSSGWWNTNVGVRPLKQIR